MGRLIAKRFRTSTMGYLADHTYVECGAGRAWGCWGGKAGGKLLDSGVGSTNRANMIAGLDERAGITRYLIDGVCHQAANRILAPAGILVSNARGYWLSQFVFGAYGRSTFNMHAGITGDLQECTTKAAEAVPITTFVSRTKDRERYREHALVRSNKAYQAHQQTLELTDLDLLNFNVRRFVLDVGILLDDALKPQSLAGLRNAKSSLELNLFELEAVLTSGRMNSAEFVRTFDESTDKFQDNAANVLNEREYQELFRESRDSRIRLTDPEAVDEAFGPGTFQRAKSRAPM